MLFILCSFNMTFAKIFSQRSLLLLEGPRLHPRYETLLAKLDADQAADQTPPAGKIYTQPEYSAG